MREFETPPKARQVAGAESLVERPIWDYHEHFDAEADRRYFIRKHSNSATDEDLQEEKIAQAKRMRAGGMSWRALDLAFGASRNGIRYLIDEEFRRREVKRICTQQSKARAA